MRSSDIAFPVRSAVPCWPRVSIVSPTHTCIERFAVGKGPPTLSGWRYLLALLCVLFFPAFASADPPPGAKLMPLRVAMCFEEPLEGLAMCSFTKEGKPIGYLPDLAGALAAYLDRPLRILPYSEAELYTSLERGEADIVIYPGSPPPGLAPHLALSQPWSGSCLAVLAPKSVPVEDGVPYFPIAFSIRHKFVPDFIMPVSVVPPGTGEFFEISELKHIRAVADYQAGLAEILRSPQEGTTSSNLKARDGLAAYPCLILPLRVALLTSRKYSVETRVLGLVSKDPEEWRIAMSSTFADDGAQSVDRFISQFRIDKGFENLEREYLDWEMKTLEHIGLPPYSDCRCNSFKYKRENQGK